MQTTELVLHIGLSVLFTDSNRAFSSINKEKFHLTCSVHNGLKSKVRLIMSNL